MGIPENQKLLRTLTSPERSAILAMVLVRAPDLESMRKATIMYEGFTGPFKDKRILEMLYDGITQNVWPWSKIE